MSFFYISQLLLPGEIPNVRSIKHGHTHKKPQAGASASSSSRPPVFMGRFPLSAPFPVSVCPSVPGRWHWRAARLARRLRVSARRRRIARSPAMEGRWHPTSLQVSVKNMGNPQYRF